VRRHDCYFHTVHQLSFLKHSVKEMDLIGRAIAQAVSRRLPTAAVRVRAQVRSCGICGGQSGTGAGFLRVFRFPLPILIPPTAPHSSSIIRGWYNRPVSGRRTKWTQSHPTSKNGSAAFMKCKGGTVSTQLGPLKRGSIDR
jgi:hypothetical protein